MLFNHFIICRSLLLLPSVFPSIRVFSNELALCSRWPKYWSFSFSISLSSEYSGLISFRIDWFELLAVQGIQESQAPQFQNISFLVLSLLYSPTLISVHDYRKNLNFDYSDLCQQSDDSIFNMLSRFVKAFLPRSKHVLISWLQSPCTVILEPKKIKSAIASTFPLLFVWSDRTRCHDLSFRILF